MDHLQTSNLHASWTFDSVRHRKSKAMVDLIDNIRENKTPQTETKKA